MRLLERLDHHATHSADREAVSLRDAHGMVVESITFACLRDAVAVFANQLHETLSPGSALLIVGLNRPRMTVAILAALAAGLKVFPLSAQLTAHELRDAATRTSADGCIGDGGLRQTLPARRTIPWSQVPLEGKPGARMPDIAAGELLLQSSGTTAAPTIVRRSAGSLDAVAFNVAEAIGMTEHDRVLCVLPTCHSYGIEHGLLAPLAAGSTVEMLNGFDLPNVLERLGSGAISIFPGVPFMFESLAAARVRPGAALRRVYSAGAPLPASTQQALLEQAGLRVSQLYGATEIGSVTFNTPDVEPYDPASVGRPMRGVEIRILDPLHLDVDRPLAMGQDGHVAIAAPSMLAGYVGRETCDVQDGYYLTGDLGRLDRHGRLTLTGRIKLLLEVGGQKVNPLEVEQVLCEHPAVREAVVVPVRASDTVQRLKAIVCAADGRDAPAPQQLRQWCRERLAPYKVPRLFEFSTALPRSASGKILRQQLEQAS